MSKFTKIKKAINILLLGNLTAIVHEPLIQSFKKELSVADRILPKTEMIDSITNKAIERPKFLCIDNFTLDDIPIDFDWIPDTKHGCIVSGILEHETNADVYKKDIIPIGQRLIGKDECDCINDVLKEVKDDTIKYDAINISLGRPYNIKKMGENIGVNDLDYWNILPYRTRIRNYLKTSNDRTENVIAESLDLMDSISKKGTRIYVCAGNEGCEEFNLYNLGQRNINVGAKGRDDKIAGYSCANRLVNRWENGTLDIVATQDGYNIYGGTQTDIYKNQTTSRLQYNHNTELMGTSFATPRAIVRDYKNNVFK